MPYRSLFNKLLCTGILLAWSLAAFAAIPLRGTVSDSSGEPLAGVVVYESGSAGSMTDLDGKYEIEVSSPDAMVTFSLMGYASKELRAGKSGILNVVLESDDLFLEELVIVGYGVQKRANLTGSVSSINNQKLSSMPADNVTNMLGGKLPGLISRQTSGLPGENESQIYIRGISTTGTSKPLILVDGVERDFANLDPSEIASVTILKDAASAAVYGVKGANGVILVTTRRGDNAKATISYSGQLTLSQNAAMIELLDGPSFAKWHNMASDLDGISRQYSEEEIAYIEGRAQDPQGIFADTDWLSLIFKKVAIGHNHNLSVSGGTSKVRYFVGGNILNQDGVISNVDFKRYNLRSNIDVDVTERLTLKIDIAGRIEKRHQSGVSAGSSDPTASLDNGGKEYGYKNVVFYAISARPTINPMTPDGTYLGYYNPLIARDHSGFNDKEGRHVQTSAALEYRIPKVKGLLAKVLASYDFSNSFSKHLLTPYSQTTPQYGSRDSEGLLNLTPGNSPHMNSGTNELTQTESSFSRYTFQAMVNYNRNFSGKHDLGADLVWEQSGTYSRSWSAAKRNFAITEIPDFNFSTDVSPNSLKGNHSQTGRQGLLARANYSYDSRYILQASLRTDWSAKFAKGHRAGFFPAVSAGWKISEEDFMKSARGILDNLKLRASWGMLGNDAIADFLYAQGVGISSNPTVSISGSPSQSLSTTSIPNTEITWETTTTYDAGVELSLWGGKLGFEGDVFYKVTKDILQSQSGQYPPSVGGYYPAIVNDGIIDVRGYEAVLSHAGHKGDFSYNISANVSFARNRYIRTTDSDNIPSYQRKIGRSLGGVMGYVSDGLYQSEEEIAMCPKIQEGVRVGDIKYKDLNGDGRITLEDRTWIAKSQIPEYMFGLNFDARYKGIDLSLFFQGAAGSQVMLSGTYSALGYADGTYYTQAFKWGSNPPKYLVEGSWRPDNTDARYPRLSTQTSSNNAQISDFWARSASYIRLKSMQLGYTLPSSASRKMKIDNLRIYASASNVFTISALSKLGIDPEAPSVNNGYYPQQRVWSMGINLSF